jgi:hypothetical protein
LPHAADPAFDAYANWLGIPLREQPPNHYALLGLPPLTADPQAIECAADARMALLKTHQSGRHQALSQRLLNEVAAARLCLLHPERKTRYDELLILELSRTRKGAVAVESLLPPELPVEPPPQPPSIVKWMLDCFLRKFAATTQRIKTVSPGRWALRLWVLLVVALLAIYLLLVFTAVGKNRGRTPPPAPASAQPRKPA